MYVCMSVFTLRQEKFTNYRFLLWHFLLLYVFVLWGRVSLCSQSWAVTQYLLPSQAHLGTRIFDLPLAFSILEVKGCTTRPSICNSLLCTILGFLWPWVFCLIICLYTPNLGNSATNIIISQFREKKIHSVHEFLSETSFTVSVSLFIF